MMNFGLFGSSFDPNLVSVLSLVNGPKKSRKLAEIEKVALKGNVPSVVYIMARIWGLGSASALCLWEGIHYSKLYSYSRLLNIGQALGSRLRSDCEVSCDEARAEPPAGVMPYRVRLV